MKYISTFSDIEAASVAWEPLGWEPIAFSEIEPFPCTVLAERFPDVPNLGDVRKVDWSAYAGKADLMVGGSPCQSFSIAGKREGLDGASGLMWEWVRCVREVRPRWVVWENVPGCLSSGGGEDFRCLLRSLDDLGYDACWRVLDARFFGVPQRRRRVFLVGNLAGGRGGRHLPCEVLLEPEGLPWDTGEGREEGKGAAGGAGGRPASAGFKSNPSGVGRSIGYEEEVSPTVLSDTHSPGVLTYGIRTANTSSNGWGVQVEESHTLGCSDRDAVAPLLVRMREGCAGGGKGPLVQRDVSGTLAMSGGVVRKLTPLECERLQGMPDGWTRVPWRGRSASECPNAPRYRAIGNSMAVPVMRWIGRRIDACDRFYDTHHDRLADFDCSADVE